MIPALQEFIKNPKDIDGLTRASRTRRSRSSSTDGGTKGLPTAPERQIAARAVDGQPNRPTIDGSSSGRRSRRRRTATPPAAEAATGARRAGCPSHATGHSCVLGLHARHPLADPHRARLAADVRLGGALVHRRGTASAASATIEWVGARQLRARSSPIYPPFWPAVAAQHVWLVVPAAWSPPRSGMFLAVLLDKEICAAAGSTRARSSCRSCSRWRWSASSGSSSTRRTTACSTTCSGTGTDSRSTGRRPGHQPLGGAGGRRLAARRLHHAPLPGRPEERRPVAAGGRGDRRRERVADVLPGGLPGRCGRSTSSCWSSR